MAEPPAALLVLLEEQRWWSHLSFLLKPSHGTVNKSAGGEFHGRFAIPTSKQMLFATSLPFAFHF